MDDRSPRRRVVVIVAATAVPLLALALGLVYTLQAAEREAARGEQLATARAGRVAAESYLYDNLQLLAAISERFRDMAPGEPARDDFLVRTADRNPAVVALSVVDSRGAVFATSRSPTAGLDPAGGEYVQAALASDAPVISGGFYSAVAQGTIITINLPLTLAGGERGLVVAALTLDDFADALADLVPQQVRSRISVVDQNGQVLLSPTRGDTPLTLASDHPAVVRARRGESGSIEVENDGDRVVSFVPVEGVDWVVLASQPRSVAYANAELIVRRGLLLVAVTVGLVAAVGALLGRSVTRSYAETIAARRQAEDALQVREEFLAVAAHELRNPVSAIRGTAQLMQRRQRDVSLDPRDREYLDMLLTSSAHLARLVGELLDVARLERGELRLKGERIDLADVLREATSAWPDDHPLELQGADESVMVVADRDRVLEVIGNLLENAAKYSPPGTPVTVTLTATGATARLAVTDRGLGLGPEDAARLFQPFGRTVTARESGIMGLGLGLYISRGIAEAFGGTLVAESPGRNQGCTFTLTLPLASSVVPPLNASDHTRP